MDFAILPPEINSGRMYAGPGAGPMLAAASAWDGLAAELYIAAASFGSVVSDLTAGPWLGPSSTVMTAAAAPYVAWLSATAAQAEQAGAQAEAAAGAFEAAFATTVPPEVIAANRSLLMALIAANFFGQNTPAIAATEAHYSEMWAQDAAAMYGYAEASLAASRLEPFTFPPITTNPAGLAGQAVVLAHTSTTSAANAQTTLSGFTAALLAALQQLVSHDPFGATPLIGPTLWWSIAGPVGPPNLATRIVTVAQAAASRLAEAELESAPASWAGPGLTPAILAGAQSPSLSGGPAGVSAGWGQAGSIGGLSVPRSWIAATPAISPAAAVAQPANIGAAAAVTGTPWHEMALAHLPAVQQ